MSQPAHLAACLASLRAHAPSSPVLDIVVVLNGATPEVRAVARASAGIRIIESVVNRGFAGGCQLGARTSSAASLLLLNDDVRVTAGWLPPLLETMRERPRAGAVAPRVLSSDGTVQEIGSILWRDGTTRPLARGLPASSVAWRWRRRVDYASGCALLVRRAAWDAVGGLDEDYHPAYYEDVDFCLALERAGFEVWADPRSDVVHAESASSAPAFKQYLFGRNHARLVERWAGALATRVSPPSSADNVAAAERAAVERLDTGGCRVLVVDDRVPCHGIGSGFDRMADIVLAMAGGGLRVRCLASTGSPDFVPALAAAGVAVIDGNDDDVLVREMAGSDVVLVSRPNNAARVHTALDRLPVAGRPPYVYDAEALYHRRIERQAALSSGPAAAVLQRQAAHWQHVERDVASRADAVICVSEDEARFFTRAGADDVYVRTPWLRQPTLTDRTLAGRADIGFVAGWLAGEGSPNADALEWFASEVLPLVAAEVPWVRLRVTGTLPPSVRHLEGVHLRAEGFVEDLALFYRQLRVAIAPLRYGSGVKLKTLEAVQYGVPVVATSVGAEGLAALGEAVAVHDTPMSLAGAIVARLLETTVWRRHRRSIEAALGRARRDDDWAALVTSVKERGADVGRAV